MTTYTNAKYCKGSLFGDDSVISISVTINGIKSGVPIDINNRDYRKLKPLIDSALNKLSAGRYALYRLSQSAGTLVMS